MPPPYGPDTIQDYQLAAEQRYLEARCLTDNGQSAGAVYLFGYVAEMLIKAATLRFVRGGALLDPISPAERDAVKAMMKADLRWHPQYPQLIAGQHNFLGWVNWLVLHSGARYTPHFGNDLLMYAENIHQHWDPNMRYHAIAVTPAALTVVRTAVEWLRAEYSNM